MKRLFSKIRLRLSHREAPRKIHQQKKTITIVFDKRQKFVIGVFLLSFILFISEFYHFRFSKSGLVISLILSFVSDLLLYWAVRKDIPKKIGAGTYTIFILPF